MPVLAQDPAFPSRQIRIVVGTVAGTLVDQSARYYAEKMSVFLKQPVVVENVSGASSLLAIRQVMKAPADGYTLLAAANTLVTVPHVNPRAGYAVSDFTAIGEMVRSPSLLVTRGAGPYRTLAELIAAARKSPGQVSYGSAGIGATNHLPVELLARQAGVSFTHVPYKGIGAALPDAVAGRLSFVMGAATSMAELLKSGTLRPLAISLNRRSPKFPDVPTFRELGYPDVTFEVWVGVVGPAGIPAAAKSRLAEAMAFARADHDIIRRLDAVGQEISPVRTPEQFAGVLRTDEDKFRKLIRDANIIAD
ncbi:tripartite tricarboxylate transporter substrate binding protein [Cupriavidus basilensis]|uniref:Tripartite tricarboxylate transporter substrate binding protein n=1 Tax=Cupriavidus basilensis TaxID=68895 RepID=A0ABT6B4X1_9BURK|nr:tripartite tricarboxylate transporter substrate binding protein [Cupriavidus basilensis]MDF3839920.1 tripartite tricarboxylate transporter substrate binding protein [Cupriavidus basilensis]